MCVIIHKPKEVGFKEEDIRKAYSNNPHGFGYMYYDPKLKKIVAKKSKDTKPDQIVQIFERLKDFEACFHYRWKTHGEITDAQCHPFKILDKKRHGMDMYMMHNGVISGAGQTLKESDTQAFVRNFMKPILRTAPSLIKTEAFQKLVEDFIGRGSKLCFMYGDGKVVKLNETAGSTYNDCWVSNFYSFNAGYRDSKNYLTTTTTGKTIGGNTVGASNAYSSTKGFSSSVNNKLPKKTKTFLEVEVEEGDTVYVWDHNNEEFFAEGVIDELVHSSCAIVFEDSNGKEQRLMFWLDDGTSYVQNNNYYYAIPTKEFEYWSPTKEETNKQTVLEKKEEMKPSTTETETSTSTSGVETKKEASNIITLEEVKKNKIASQKNDTISKTVLVSSGETKEVLGQEDGNSEYLLEYDGFTVDTKDSYGGAFVNHCMESYKLPHGDEDINYADIAYMSCQERLEFFINNIEVAFNMWQDLCENITIQDEEFFEDFNEYLSYYSEEDELRKDFNTTVHDQQKKGSIN